MINTTSMDRNTNNNLTSKVAKYKDYNEYIAASLKEADAMAADGTMKYYTAEEIRAKLERVLNQNT